MTTLRPSLLVVPVPSARLAVLDQRALTSSPWQVGWCLALLSTTAVGLIAVLYGWYGASGQGVLARQMPFLSTALAGTVVAGLGNCGWLLRGRRSVGELRRSLLVAAPPSARPAEAVATSAPAGWVQAPGMTLRHLASCLLVAGKQVCAVELDAAPACAVCGGLG